MAIVQSYVPDYRVPFFDELAKQLALHGLVLEVWHDAPRGDIAKKGNARSGTWSRQLRLRQLRIAGKKINYRHVQVRARKVAAVIAGLASGSLESYGLAVDPKVILLLWGHGRNYLTKTNRLDGRLEHWLMRHARHILTYTEGGRIHLIEAGVAPEKLSAVNNTTDTSALRTERDRLTEGEVLARRTALHLPSQFVCLYVGAFDVSKRLPFLFEAADLIVEQIPEFVLVLAGDGPLKPYVQREAAERDHVRVIGRFNTEDWAAAGRFCDALLMPGRVGLVATDALAAGLVLVTTDYPYHAPEAEYLDDSNSVRAPDDVEGFAGEVCSLLLDRTRLDDLKAGALRSSEDYTVQKMAAIFVAAVTSQIERSAKR